MDLLLKWGADPEVRDNDGVTPKSVARWHPQMLASMHQQQVQAMQGSVLVEGFILIRCC